MNRLFRLGNRFADNRRRDSFYAAVPRNKSSLLEKQVSALFANARIEEKEKITIFFSPAE